MFISLFHPYEFMPTEIEQALLDKYAAPEDLALGDQFKLAILIDTYNGNYDQTVKDEFLVTLYCKILIALCHFNGKWLPDPSFRWNPLAVTTENEILANGKKFEPILNCIFILLHGKTRLAEETFLKLQQNTKEDLSALWKEYKDKYWEEEKAIISQCLIHPRSCFYTTVYINTQREAFKNEHSHSPSFK